jgi:hypothetical protein
MPIFTGPIPGLPAARAYLRGPSRRVLLKLIRHGDLVWPPDDDVDERVTEQLRPNVAAQWTDPRERLARD